MHPRDLEDSTERFGFGKNWYRFLKVVNDGRLEEAQVSLLSRLQLDTLSDKTFLDVGSGSGLFSLAARRLGARVFSFDSDQFSVASTRVLQERYSQRGVNWRIDQGSILDEDYLSELGTFDIVYSWGVLHHTGNMWQALTNVIPLVRPGGLLFIALYNDQGAASRRWHAIKRSYNRSSAIVKYFLIGISAGWLILEKLRMLVRPRSDHIPQATRRGMSLWYDLLDWVGGYPFEVAKPNDVIDFYRARGFGVRQVALVGTSLGCNEFIFERLADHPAER